MLCRLRAGAALCLALLAGCTSAGGGAQTHVLRIADTSDPDSLNPLLAHDQDTIGWDLLVTQTLVGLNARNELVPILITRVPTRANGDISPDGVTIVYHLKPARFADGTPLTSADVAFTYRAILDAHNAVLSQDAYRRIAALQTPNAHTVIIRLRKPWNAATSVLFAQADFAFGILPAHAFQSSDLSHDAWEEHPFGSGPFRVVTWQRGDRIVLEPNPYFFPRPKLTRIVLKLMPNPTSAFVALRTHEVDLAVLTPDELTTAASLPGVHIVKTPENDTVWLSLQTRTAPTDDRRVREAIAAGLDLAALQKTYDAAYPLAGSFLPPVFTRWHDTSILPYHHDDAHAAELLDAAGWHLRNSVRTKNGTPLEGSLVLIARQPDLRISTVLQAQLAALGMRVTIKPYPTTLFNALDGPIRNGRFTFSEDGWLGGGDPEQSIVFACEQIGVDGNNISRYCNPAFDALFHDQQVAPSEEQRRDDLVRMQHMIHDDLPVVPLYYERYLEAVDSHVRGFQRNMLRYPVNAELWDAH